MEPGGCNTLTGDGGWGLGRAVPSLFSPERRTAALRSLLEGDQVFVNSIVNHRPTVENGPLANEAAALLRAFFADRR